MNGFDKHIMIIIIHTYINIYLWEICIFTNSIPKMQSSSASYTGVSALYSIWLLPCFVSQYTHICAVNVCQHHAHKISDAFFFFHIFVWLMRLLHILHNNGLLCFYNCQCCNTNQILHNRHLLFVWFMHHKYGFKYALYTFFSNFKLTFPSLIKLKVIK